MVQVLSDALAVWDLKVIRAGSSSDTNKNPLYASHISLGIIHVIRMEEAFICNLAAHWLTVRKVEGSWFNFNSVFRAPEPLSEFYLRYRRVLVAITFLHPILSSCNPALM